MKENTNNTELKHGDVLLEVVDLHKSFGDNHVLKGVSTTIRKGEKVVVIGPSGSGKSTFLRCLNCMEDPTGGKIIFHGVDIADPKVDINVHRQKMGMVFQHFNLFPHMTVIENIMAAPMDLLGMDIWHLPTARLAVLASAVKEMLSTYINSLPLLASKLVLYVRKASKRLCATFSCPAVELK